VVNPDKVGLVKSDGITTPHVFVVDVRNLDVLDDDVLGAVDDAQALALDDALAALTHERLVRTDIDAESASLVVCDAAGPRSLGLVVLAPLVLVDGDLASGSGTPRQAAAGRRSAFRSGEVKTASYQHECFLSKAENDTTNVLLKTMTRAVLSPR